MLYFALFRSMTGYYFFIFAHDLARIFISKKQIQDPSQNQLAIP
jgi:hypothetical protein